MELNHFHGKVCHHAQIRSNNQKQLYYISESAANHGRNTEFHIDTVFLFVCFFKWIVMYMNGFHLIYFLRTEQIRLVPIHSGLTIGIEMLM